MYIIVCEWFWHKINHFLFCKKFEKKFTTCAKSLIIIIKSKFEVLQLSSFNFIPTTFSTEECDSLNTFRLSHKDNKIMFIVLYKYYMLNFS